MSDRYTVKETALALGISDKRVRQLITEGKLIPVSLRPVMLDQLEVINLRELRAQLPTIKKARNDAIARSKNRDALLVDQFQTLINQIMENSQKQLDSVTDALKYEKENYLKVLVEKEAEIIRLKELAERNNRGFISKLFRKG
jgi:hypothetical protein